VADRLRTSRVGILLSGGLDSSSVAATAREILKSGGGTADLRAYTVTYESLLPEQGGKYARELAASFQIPIRCLPMDDLQFFERWDDPDFTSPESVDDPFLAGLFDQTDAIAWECRVVLSGEGIDNLMHFQMRPYVRSRIRRREWRSALRDVARYWRMRPSIWPSPRNRNAGARVSIARASGRFRSRPAVASA
jgi:asparagine synthase (glutamine-hydrolysing)